MDKFQNKYRITSHRMPGWDYSGNGFYFITLVTQNRECNLGKIANDIMVLSDFGKIVNSVWEKSFEIRDELFMKTYIIMPNHLHAIVVLDKIGINNDDASHVSHVPPHLETHSRASINAAEHAAERSVEQSPQSFYRKPKSISSFVGGFKSAVNSKIDDFIDENNLKIPKYNRNNHFFQSNYHDHIIRNDKSYQTISKYIVNNPLQWKMDTFHPKKLDTRFFELEKFPTTGNISAVEGKGI
ncbi:MAG: hypothetical protein ABIA63_12810 [bacterium]